MGHGVSQVVKEFMFQGLKSQAQDKFQIQLFCFTLQEFQYIKTIYTGIYMGYWYAKYRHYIEMVFTHRKVMYK